MKKSILLLIIGFIFISFLHGFEQKKDIIDNFFNHLEENNQAMGNISLFKDGQEIYNNSMGFREIELKRKIDSNTKFRIGSISKTFTAVIIIQMIEEGKLSYETRLSDYCPQIPNADLITIEHLLRHQSGIFNFTNDENYVKWMEKPVKKAELIKIIADYEPIFNPGEKGDYSNSNFVLLSYIAEKTDKKDFKKILNTRIVKPLKLKNTYYGSKINPKKNEAKSYYKTTDWTLATETDMSVPVGAGAIVSNPYDLNIFFTNLFAGKLISEASLAKMTKIENHFGLGIFKIPFYDKFAYGHTGGIDGFQAVATYFPDEKISVAYNSNGVSYPQNSILIGVLSIFFEMDYEFPEFQEGVKLPLEILNTLTGDYKSDDLPIGIKIFIKDEALWAQGSGQDPFPLDAEDENTFNYMPANIKLKFDVDKKQMILIQSSEYIFYRD